MAHTSADAKCRYGLFAVAVVLAWMGPTASLAQTPRLGEVQRMKVITLSLHVGSTEKETRQVSYTPPPGWYVRSHAVECTREYGHSSFTVNTVPRDWAWSSEEKLRESYDVLIDLAAKAKDVGMQSHFALERETLLSDLRKVRASHHALVVEATAKGEGFLRGGGGLELTVTADLVYVGTQMDLNRAVAGHRARLK